MIENCTYTNVGNRETNEDYILSRNIGQDVSLHIVADGMGGYKAGELASKIVAENIYQAICNGCTIKDSVNAANLSLSEEKKALGVAKMGTTIAGVLISGLKASIFWSGDSRVYIYRKNEMFYRTDDHSLLSELSKHRRITTDIERKYGNIVTKAIMGNDTDEVEIYNMQLMSNDEILICSDGIYKDCSIEFLMDVIRLRTYETKLQNELFSDNHSFVYVKICEP